MRNLNTGCCIALAVLASLSFAQSGSQNGNPGSSPASASGGGTLTGHLHLLSSDAVISAQVTAWSETGITNGEDSLAGKAVALVSPDGVWTMTGMAPGDYFIQAWAEGYEVLYYNNTPDFDRAAAVTLTGMETVSRLDFNMIRIVTGAGSISGHVTDQAGHPINSAEIIASNQASGSSFYSSTDDNGYYEISGLRGGSYILWARAEGFRSVFYQNAFSEEDADVIVIDDSSRIAGIDFELGRGAGIQGVLTDSSGMPLADVFVQAVTGQQDSFGPIEPYMPYYNFYSGVTDQNGYYQITGMPAGLYTLFTEIYAKWGGSRIYYPGVADQADALPLTLQEETQLTGIDFQVIIIPPSGVIEGRVLDAGGLPVEGAAMSLGAYPPYRSYRGYWDETLTDSTGYYRLENIPDDQYFVMCTIDNPWNPTVYFRPGTDIIEDAAPLIITGDARQHQNIDFHLPVSVSRAVISGHVREAGGALLSYASLQLIQVQESFQDRWIDPIWTSTDSSGAYRVTHVPAGEYHIVCEYWEEDAYGKQYYDHSESEETADIVSVAGNIRLSGIDFDLTLHPLYGSLEGTVKNMQDQPVAGVYVEVMPATSRMTLGIYTMDSGQSMHTLTDAQGRYSFGHLFNGTYRIAAYADGGYAFYPDAIVWEQAVPVTLAGGESLTADFSLSLSEYSAHISGRVTMTDYPYPVYGMARSASDEMMTLDSDVFVVTARPVISIQVWPESERVFAAVTGEDGRYDLSCPPGDYLIQAFSSQALPKYYRDAYEPSKAEIITTSAALPAAGFDLSLYPKLMWCKTDSIQPPNEISEIFGRVLTEFGEAVSGAVIYLLDMSGNPLFSVLTDQDGNYSINGLENGSYYVQAQKAGIGMVYNGNAGSLEEAGLLDVYQTGIELNLTLQAGSGIPGNTSTLPETVVLAGNYPNPFNPETRIRFVLPEPLSVTLTVHNARGEQILCLADDEFKAGEHALIWSGLTETGESAASGLYFIRLKAGSAVRTAKMVLIR